MRVIPMSPKHNIYPSLPLNQDMNIEEVRTSEEFEASQG